MAKPKPKSRWHLVRVLTCLVLVSLVWPLSYFCADRLNARYQTRQIMLAVGPGWIAFTLSHSDVISRIPEFQNRFEFLDSVDRLILSHPRIFSSGSDYHLYCPLWLIALACTLLSIAMVLSHLRQHRNYKPGCCDVCGYDLRASPQRCPECGTARIA